ncbi:hypothetical protein [Natrialba asiatica]|uniref:Immunoglobulin G binding protein A n=1 Tax=Natrialba asiatica (strain ATCC 700177 / DSM 12278 / JCM 9576 / FERM P-10747 / NBRC 102637 / 172P1) TaxID=29540 RepID=M0AU37_NATA1|nr:hypothetical protein [Natrialba asiatica]ELZ01852.1 Immunoglobulin G binding protein A precursor [Natrialba asiatica DSM 12278]
MTDDHSSSTRRNVLRTTGIVSLGAIGLTGAASAHSGEKKDDKKHGKKDDKKHDKKDDKKHDKKHGKKDDKKHDKKHGKKDDKKHGKKDDKKHGKKDDKKHGKKDERHKQNGIVVELGGMRIRIGDYGISVKTSNGTSSM